MNKLTEQTKRLNELSKDLQKSLEIENMFKGIFKNGGVKFSGIQKMMPDTYGKSRPKTFRKMGFISSYFIDSKGVKHHLTKEQLSQFKPDALIHPLYKNEG